MYRRSKTALGSECCITPSCSSPLGLDTINRSESSLCSQMGDFAAEKPEALRKMLGSSPYTAFSTLSPLSLKDSDSVTLAQCLLLVAMALQIPNYIDEIIEILKLHIHSFPLLFVLGVFPLYFKKKQHKKDSSSNLMSLSTSSIASTCSKTLAGIEEYYRKCAGSNSTFVTTSSLAKSGSAHTLTDDWGQFTSTDSDESPQFWRPDDICTTAKPLYSH